MLSEKKAEKRIYLSSLKKFVSTFQMSSQTQAFTHASQGNRIALARHVAIATFGHPPLAVHYALKWTAAFLQADVD